MKKSLQRFFPLAWTIVFLALVVGVTPNLVHAQQRRTITFNEAIQIALDQNIALKRSANSVELQSAVVASERADFLPNLNFSSSSGMNFGLNIDQTTGNASSENTSSASLSLSSGVNLFNGFGDVASLNQARLNLEANDLSYERQRQTVVFNVMSNYLNLIQQQEQIRIREENLAAQRQLLTQIEEFTRVGSRPVSDLFQQQAAVASAELNLLSAQRLYQLGEVNLIQTLQLDPFDNYQFEVFSVEDAELVPENYDIQQLLRSAFEQRPDLRAQETAINASSEGIRVAKSGLYPTLSLSGNISSRYSSLGQRIVGVDAEGNPLRDAEGNVLLEDKPFGTQLGDNRAQAISLSLQVPIFNRLQTKTNIERARVQFENSRLDLEDLQQNIALQVRQSYLDYVSDLKRLEVTEVQLRSAQQALDAEQERYNVGASTLVELTQARANFVQASSDRAQAKYDFLFRKRLIEYYIGVLDPAKLLFE